jgi:hypothetical protein
VTMTSEHRFGGWADRDQAGVRDLAK